MSPRGSAWTGRGACLLLLVAFFNSTSARAADPAPLEFRVTFAKAVSAEPFTGRVYVLLSKNEPKNLPSGPNWFRPEPFFAVDVSKWEPGKPLVVGADALGCPT